MVLPPSMEIGLRIGSVRVFEFFKEKNEVRVRERSWWVSVSNVCEWLGFWVFFFFFFFIYIFWVWGFVWIRMSGGGLIKHYFKNLGTYAWWERQQWFSTLFIYFGWVKIREGLWFLVFFFSFNLRYLHFTPPGLVLSLLLFLFLVKRMIYKRLNQTSSSCLRSNPLIIHAHTVIK